MRFLGCTKLEEDKGVFHCAFHVCLPLPTGSIPLKNLRKEIQNQESTCFSHDMSFSGKHCIFEESNHHLKTWLCKKCCSCSFLSVQETNYEGDWFSTSFLVPLSQRFRTKGYCLVIRDASDIIPFPWLQNLGAQFATKIVVGFSWSPVSVAVQRGTIYPLELCFCVCFPQAKPHAHPCTRHISAFDISLK